MTQEEIKDRAENIAFGKDVTPQKDMIDYISTLAVDASQSSAIAFGEWLLSEPSWQYKNKGVTSAQLYAIFDSSVNVKKER